MYPKTRQQIIALLLYPVFALIAVLSKKILLFLLLPLVHLSEYLFISRKIAKEHELPQTTALTKTLLYGFTWWKPIQNGEAEESAD